MSTLLATAFDAPVDGNSSPSGQSRRSSIQEQSPFRGILPEYSCCIGKAKGLHRTVQPSSRPNFRVVGSNNEQETCKLKISISLPFEILKLDERIIPPGNAKAVRRFQQLNCGYPNLNQRRPGQANSDGTLKAPCLRCYCNAPTPAPSASRAKPCRARSAIALARGAEAFSDSGRSSRIPSLTAYSRNR